MASLYDFNDENNGIFKIRSIKNKYKRKKVETEKKNENLKKENEKEKSKARQAKAPISLKSGRQKTNEDIRSIPAKKRRYNKLLKRKKRFTNKRPNNMAVKE